MSLLLDALKKAAEQKAEKSKQEVSPARGSDETLVDAAEDVSSLDDSTDVKLPSDHRLQDETEIEHSELETRLERTLLEREADDETGIEAPDATETEAPGASVQMQTGEDETIIFAEDDVADFMGEPQFVNREQRPPEDETDLSQLAPREDETDIGQPPPAAAAAPAPEDETDLSQYAAREDETDLSQLLAQAGAVEPAQADETDLSQVALPDEAAAVAGEDQTDLGQAPAPDETDLSGLAAAGEEATDFREQLAGEDETDISEPIATVDDLERVAAQQAAADETDLGRAAAEIESAAPAEDITDGVGDEDMSLLLVERDQTNLTDLTGPTSATDPQMPREQIQALQDGEDLALVDTTQHRGIPSASEQTETVAADTQSGATATTGINYDTQSTTRRAESTSTRTYAPDNYDRTLMRLPNEDASKLFAGMKSDSDVVMTPDYAKKVFRSKSSAQRLQHYKFYGGIAVVILLGIGVFGLFEWQDQSDSIEASLQPLKRDPMPGVVRPQTANQNANLFAGTETETEVDERTIEIIESAEQIDGEIEAEAAAGTEVETETVAAAETLSGEVGVSDESAPVQEPEAEPAEQEAVDQTGAGTEVAAVAAAPVDSDAQAATKAADAAQSTLEISSVSRIQDKDRWLHQAYQAYQAGNDELALELYNKVIGVDPGNRNALLARAAINVQNNNASDAVEDYQTLLLANPKDSLAMTSLISVANVSPEDTETRLKLMIRDDPNSPYLNFALANAYGAQNRWAEAQGHYFTALQNNPGDPNYAYNLAVSLEHISQPRAAIAYYQRALDNMENGLATFNKNLVDERLQILGKL